MVMSEKYTHNMRKSVLIIGGAGYVGRAICHLLADEGISFKIIDLFMLGASSLDYVNGQGWDYEMADIRDETVLQDIVQAERPSHIIHLAAIHFIPYCNAHPEEVIATNVNGLQNVIDTIATLSDKPKLVFTSSAAVYGGTATSYHEGSLLAPGDIYGMSKLMGEELIRKQVQDFAIARLFNVFGRSDPHAHLIPKVFTRLQSETSLELGNPHAERDFVHVDDVARALVTIALTSHDNPTFNIGTGTTRSVRETVKTIQELTDKLDVEVVYENETDMRPVDNQRLCADITHIATTLGWSPRYSFEAGLQTLSA